MASVEGNRLLHWLLGIIASLLAAAAVGAFSTLISVNRVEGALNGLAQTLEMHAQRIERIDAQQGATSPRMMGLEVKVDNLTKRHDELRDWMQRISEQLDGG